MKTTRENMLAVIGGAMDSNYGIYWEQLDSFQKILPIIDQKPSTDFTESDWEKVSVFFQDILDVVGVDDEGYNSYSQVLAVSDVG